MDGAYPIVKAISVNDSGYGHASPILGAPVNEGLYEKINLNIDEGGCREYLSVHKWPVGFQDALIENMKKMPIRCILADDSGSMSINDGNKLVEAGKDTKMISCTRWSELVDTLQFQVGFARAANSYTEFRFLNGANPIVFGNSRGGSDEQDAYQIMKAVLIEGPFGGTPLCRHITAIIEEVRALEPALRSRRQLACIIIATDGQSSDGDLAVAMAPLKDLPVWVVIRLCTDDDTVCEYWNNIDKQLELAMDVLNDYAGEAKEVSRANPWISYGLPFHRLREIGVSMKEMDLLDEALVSIEQMKVISKLVYGQEVFNKIVTPELSIDKFLKGIESVNKNDKIGEIYCPVKGKFTTWINPKVLKKCYNNNSKICVIS